MKLLNRWYIKKKKKEWKKRGFLLLDVCILSNYVITCMISLFCFCLCSLSLSLSCLNADFPPPPTTIMKCKNLLKVKVDSHASRDSQQQKKIPSEFLPNKRPERERERHGKHVIRIHGWWRPFSFNDSDHWLNDDDHHDGWPVPAD